MTTTLCRETAASDSNVRISVIEHQLRRIFLSPVYLYKKLISPFMPPACRFHPTCSEYAIEAVSKFGILKGSWLSAGRLLRCQPLCEGGPDPVPGSRDVVTS